MTARGCSAKKLRRRCVEKWPACACVHRRRRDNPDAHSGEPCPHFRLSNRVFVSRSCSPFLLEGEITWNPAATYRAVRRSRDASVSAECWVLSAESENQNCEVRSPKSEVFQRAPSRVES